MSRWQVRVYGWSGTSLGFLGTLGEPCAIDLAARLANGHNAGTLTDLRKGEYPHQTFHLAVAEKCEEPARDWSVADG